MGLITGLRTRYKRWRLRRAYSTLVARRDGMDGALSGLMATWFEMQADGVISITDGEIEWHWPDAE